MFDSIFFFSSRRRHTRSTRDWSSDVCSSDLIFDLPNLMRGFRCSIAAMWDEVSRIDLTTAVPALQMPVFFFLGRNDHWVPPETSVAYFDALTAPSKRLVWFEESGHEPFADEPAKFNTLMVELVRPVVVESARSRLKRGSRPG